ncbi:MAG: hypothetical protein Q3M24_20785 [Candidatus Electrothrix aestuarii]|uniref:Uncharacterized protein n=1 Tax=Candidatus Electrothrix aestuarii TaxID=3062594 RepID=A0AAU8LTR9_9BACT|nr:hypothetical protein [Candidatus Electrothrix aestuarii]
MINKKSYAIVSLTLMILPFFGAIYFDTFTTAFLAVPAMLYLSAVILKAASLLIKRKHVHDNALIMVTALLFLPVIFTALLLSNRGLRELTAQREQMLQELRPVFLKYAEDNKRFPENLEQMVPNYLEEIPIVLLNDKRKDSYKRIAYSGEQETGVFSYHSMRGPDSGITYDIAKDEFTRDQ